MSNNVLDSFIGKKVEVIFEDGFSVIGIIKAYQHNNRNNHLPPVFVVENQSGKLILRGSFISISTGDVKNGKTTA